jgi:hypothetical protein
MCCPGRDVGGGESEKLLPGVDLLMVAVGECPPSEHVVGIRDDGETQGGKDEMAEIDERHGDRHRRQVRRHRADELDALVLEIEQGNDDDGQTDTKERHRSPWSQPSCHQQEREDRGGEDGRRGLQVLQMSAEGG